MRERIFEAMKNTEVARAMQTGSQKSVLDALKNAGVACSASDLAAMFTANGELSEDELVNVVGGEMPNTCGEGAAIVCTISILGAVAAFV